MAEEESVPAPVPPPELSVVGEMDEFAPTPLAMPPPVAFAVSAIAVLVVPAFAFDPVPEFEPVPEAVEYPGYPANRSVKAAVPESVNDPPVCCCA